MVSGHACDDFWWGVWIRKTVASRFDNVFVGVLAAWCRFYFPEKWNQHTIAKLVAGLAIMVVVCLTPRHINTLYANVFALTIPPIAIALWLPFFSQLKSYKTWAGKAVTEFSVLSYAMYLTNLLVCQIIAAHYADAFHQWGVGGYILYWLIVLLGSYLLYIAVEKPFMKIRSKI
ncbi:MAG: hypothetical protein J5741_07385 [Bacteroidales bacterium]|nr:hypothetical protein [Bacteroidales bacterium]